VSQEPALLTVRTRKPSRDLAARVDSAGLRTNRCIDVPWYVEGSGNAFPASTKPMRRTIAAAVLSHDYSPIVDPEGQRGGRIGKIERSEAVFPPNIAMDLTAGISEEPHQVTFRVNCPHGRERSSWKIERIKFSVAKQEAVVRLPIPIEAGDIAI